MAYKEVLRVDISEVIRRWLSIYRDFDPVIYTDIDPPWELGDFQYYQVAGCRSITSFPGCADQRAVRRLALPVALALDDDLVAGVGQPVESTVAEYGIVEEAEPFVHRPVAGDHEAGGPVAVKDQLIEVGGLLCCEAGAGPGRR